MEREKPPTILSMKVPEQKSTKDNDYFDIVEIIDDLYEKEEFFSKHGK